MRIKNRPFQRKDFKFFKDFSTKNLFGMNFAVGFHIAWTTKVVNIKSHKIWNR